MKIKRTKCDIIFDIVNYILLGIFTLLCFYPFYYIFIYSISDPMAASKGQVILWPVDISIISYVGLLSKKEIYSAAFISGARAVIGTLITIFCSSLFAYILTKKQLFLRRIIYRLVVMTMYLNAGLIPWYMTMKTIGLKNNFLLYVLPSAISAFYIILMKTYIEQLPVSVEESAMIDGAGYFTIFIRIIFPLSLPIIATVAIFSAVGQWNSWQDNFYLVSSAKLNTLQLVLLNYLSSFSQSMSNTRNAIELTKEAKKLTPTSIQMAISMIVILPIMLVYPMLQKYFLKGIMLGAVKG